MSQILRHVADPSHLRLFGLFGQCKGLGTYPWVPGSVSFGWPLVANLWDEFDRPRKLGGMIHGVKDKRGFRLPRLRLPRGPRVRLPHLKVNVGADEAKTALKADLNDSVIQSGSALILESVKQKQEPFWLNWLLLVSFNNAWFQRGKLIQNLPEFKRCFSGNVALSLTMSLTSKTSCHGGRAIARSGRGRNPSRQGGAWSWEVETGWDKPKPFSFKWLNSI